MGFKLILDSQSIDSMSEALKKHQPVALFLTHFCIIMYVWNGFFCVFSKISFRQYYMTAYSMKDNKMSKWVPINIKNYVNFLHSRNNKEQSYWRKKAK